MYQIAPQKQRKRFSLFIIALLLAAAAAFWLIPSNAAIQDIPGLTKDGGTYLIATSADLAAFCDAVNTSRDMYGSADAKLTADIELDGSDSNRWTPITNYWGTFDGQGYTVSGLYVDTNSNGGFFDYIHTGSHVCNLIISGELVCGGTYVGGIAAENYGTISNCTVKCKRMKSNFYTGAIGGIAGYNVSGIISNCRTTSDVEMIYVYNGYAGGIAGSGGEIDNCIAECREIQCYKESCIGGISGSGGTLTNCVAKVHTFSKNSGSNSTEVSFGGICGRNPEKFVNCLWIKDTGYGDGAESFIGRNAGITELASVVSCDLATSNHIGLACLSAFPIDISLTKDIPVVSYDISEWIYPSSSDSTVWRANIKNVVVSADVANVEISYDNGKPLLVFKYKSYGNTVVGLSLDFYPTSVSPDITQTVSSPDSLSAVFNISCAVIPVVSVGMNAASMTVYTGESGQLSTEVNPVNATYKNVTWKSDDESTATVSPTGKVSALKAGTAIITATAAGKDDEGNYPSAHCTVTVTDPPALDISIAPEKATIILNRELLLETNGLSSNEYVTWTVSDPSVISLSATSGRKVTAKALKIGSATVTALAEDGSTAICDLTVEKATNGSGGCSAGAGAMALLALAPLLCGLAARRRK